MGGWDIKIFDCNKNIVMFIWACCVPCGGLCMQTIDAKLTDHHKNSALIACLLAGCLGCIGSTINRYKLRDKLNIEDSIALDIASTCCCPCCAVTQEYITTVKEKKGDEKMLIWEAIKE